MIRAGNLHDEEYDSGKYALFSENCQRNSCSTRQNGIKKALGNTHDSNALPMSFL
jgi:hypothetical protein